LAGLVATPEEAGLLNRRLIDVSVRYGEADLDRVFVVSDPHFFHDKIIGYCQRPFCDGEEMNAEMIRRWNETVPPDADVWVLGDFTTDPQKLRKLVPKLNGRLHLVTGNHDQPHPVAMSRKGRTEDDLARLADDYRAAGFAGVYLGAEIEIPRVGWVNVSHYPYREAGTNDPLRVRFHDDGRYLLHGHIHQTRRRQGPMLNVSVDVQDFRPISLRDVRTALQTEPPPSGRSNGFPSKPGDVASDGGLETSSQEPETPPTGSVFHVRSDLRTGLQDAPAVVAALTRLVGPLEPVSASPDEQVLAGPGGERYRLYRFGAKAHEALGLSASLEASASGEWRVEAWFDGASTSAADTRRRLFQLSGWKVEGRQLFSPTRLDGGAIGLAERYEQFTSPTARQQQVHVGIPVHRAKEAEASLSRLLAKPQRTTEPLAFESLPAPARASQELVEFAGAPGSPLESVVIRSTRVLDEFGRRRTDREVAELRLKFRAGTTERQVKESTELLRRYLPFDLGIVTFVERRS
jgi:calcineurin-like phosphoesterase family protein